MTTQTTETASYYRVVGSDVGNRAYRLSTVSADSRAAAEDSFIREWPGGYIDTVWGPFQTKDAADAAGPGSPVA